MVIAKSDVVIMVVSFSLLAAGIYRWQSNVSQADERRAEASSPAATRTGNSQRSNVSSLAAKPETATLSVTRAAGAELDASVESNFGKAGQANALQPAAQNAAVSSGNTAITANQSSTSNTTGQPLYGTYEVEPGDTLSRIAINFGTTIVTLRTLNDISGSLITIGQKLRYPLPAN